MTKKKNLKPSNIDTKKEKEKQIKAAVDEIDQLFELKKIRKAESLQLEENSLQTQRKKPRFEQEYESEELAMLEPVEEEDIDVLSQSASYGLIDSKNKKRRIVNPEAPLERIDKETGLPVYKAHLLKVGEGGGTPDCPFDCSCCF